MTASTESVPSSADLCTAPVDADDDGFELDIRIVEAGPAEALLGDTDNGCDTVRGSDC